MNTDYITSTDLIAYSANILEDGGYKEILNESSHWNSATSRLFENSYNVVGVVAFDSCGEMLSSWADRQGQLVEIISNNIGKSEGKAWDGYLVLLTAAVAPSESEDLESIRRDTTRLRKLVATGGELKSAGDVERVLRSLLPLRSVVNELSSQSILEQLTEVLQRKGIDLQDSIALVEAFMEQRPPVEALHKSRSRQ